MRPVEKKNRPAVVLKTASDVEGKVRELDVMPINNLTSHISLTPTCEMTQTQECEIEKEVEDQSGTPVSSTNVEEESAKAGSGRSED